jgi:hypothetical protein
MTETNKRSCKTESVRDLDEQRQSVEAELVEGYGKPLTCREKTSTATEGIARSKEQRRDVLPCAFSAPTT